MNRTLVQIDSEVVMKVLVIGTSGYIGRAVGERLVAAGHRVVALVQAPGDADPALPAHEVRTGDLARPASLTAAVEPDVDAVVHLAPPTGDAGVDAAAIEALLAPLRGTGRALLYTSGLWVLGPTGAAVADEDSPVDPIDIVGYRPALEQAVLRAADDGVRAMVLRPAVTHGRGGGIPAFLVAQAREHGVGRYVGRADTRWPMVHVDDLADLFLLALERGTAGSLLHGVAEESVAVTELAAAAARAAGLDGSIEAWPIADARTALGAPFADALALSQAVSGARARRDLGWRPSRRTAVLDLVEGSYAVGATA